MRCYHRGSEYQDKMDLAAHEPSHAQKDPLAAKQGSYVRGVAAEVGHEAARMKKWTAKRHGKGAMLIMMVLIVTVVMQNLKTSKKGLAADV